MLEIVNWTATITGIVAAILVSLNAGARITGIGFCIFTVSSLFWIAGGLLDEKASLTVQNVVLFVVNVIGIYRYLWRRQPPAAPRKEATADSRPAPRRRFMQWPGVAPSR